VARINVEEEAWTRVYRLAEIMRTDIREALGTVVSLWRNSQDLIKTHGTAHEIAEWANLFKISDQEVENWIFGLEKARFISLEESGLFKIHGNEIQLESRAKHASKSSKGGKALKKKLAELKRLRAGHRGATGTPQDCHRGLNALQGITDQDIPLQPLQPSQKKEEVKLELSPEQTALLGNITGKIFQFTGDTKFIRYTDKFLERFKSSEEFNLFFEEIVEGATKVTSLPKRRTYLKTAILREIGVINESSAR
jgi:hypothetical protein